MVRSRRHLRAVFVLENPMKLHCLLLASLAAIPLASPASLLADDIQITSADSRITTSTDAGLTTYTAYDAHSTSSTTSSGLTTTNTYDAQTSTSNLGDTTTYSYDAEDTTTHTTTYSYDQQGSDSISPGDSYNNTSPNGINPPDNESLGSSVRYTYDSTVPGTTDRTTAQTDALGRTTTYQYDDKSGPASISGADALNNTTNYTYDSANHEITVTDAPGNITTTTYDAQGITTIDFVAPTTTRYSYDAVGTAPGETLSLQEDGAAVPLSGLLDPGHTYTFTYTYDFSGTGSPAVGTLDFTVVPRPPPPSPQSPSSPPSPLFASTNAAATEFTHATARTPTPPRTLTPRAESL